MDRLIQRAGAAGGGTTITVLPGPGLPVGPVLPVSPVAPVDPWLPVSPVAPVLPVYPVEPVSPVAPFGPAGPGTGACAGTLMTVGLSQAPRPNAASKLSIKVKRFMVVPLKLITKSADELEALPVAPLGMPCSALG